MAKKRLLLVEDDPAILLTLRVGLGAAGYDVDAVDSTAAALTRLAREEYPVVVTDIYLDERTGIDVLRAARDANPEVSVVVVTGQGTVETATAAAEGGASEYLAKPFDISDLLAVLDRLEEPVEPARRRNSQAEPESRILGHSPAMVEVYKVLSRVAPTDAPVLVEGESGTGKELIANTIHDLSRRSHGPFVPVDCGSLAAGIVESELFGSVRGAFTGAERDRAGLFEAAEGGTVFLDEVAEVGPEFQLKLLRFLQEKEVRPLGSLRSRKLDVRVLAATNKNVPRLVEEGKFREDLWFRLNVVSLCLPPLRDRLGDIRLLAETFLERYCAAHGKQCQFSRETLKALEDYSWPGNVRQLQHTVERLVILAPEPYIREEDLRQALEALDPRERRVESLADAEEEQIRRVLASTGGNKSRAAKILNIERKTLYRKLARMNL